MSRRPAYSEEAPSPPDVPPTALFLEGIGVEVGVVVCVLAVAVMVYLWWGRMEGWSMEDRVDVRLAPKRMRTEAAGLRKQVTRLKRSARKVGNVDEVGVAEAEDLLRNAAKYESEAVYISALADRMKDFAEDATAARPSGVTTILANHIPTLAAAARKNNTAVISTTLLSIYPSRPIPPITPEATDVLFRTFLAEWITEKEFDQKMEQLSDLFAGSQGVASRADLQSRLDRLRK